MGNIELLRIVRKVCPPYGLIKWKTIQLWQASNSEWNDASWFNLDFTQPSSIDFVTPSTPTSLSFPLSSIAPVVIPSKPTHNNTQLVFYTVEMLCTCVSHGRFGILWEKAEKAFSDVFVQTVRFDFNWDVPQFGWWKLS